MASAIHGRFDGPHSLFSGAAFIPSSQPQPSQFTADTSPFSPSKVRGPQRSVPVTVKQIAEAYHVSEDKSCIVIDGVEFANVRVFGMVMNKVEKETEVSFTLDDGTGRINIIRWVNETSDAKELASIQDGMYVHVTAHLKGFQSKKRAIAISVRPINDFDELVLHFIECMYVHLEHSRKNFLGGAPVYFQSGPNLGMSFANPAEKRYQASMTSQLSVESSIYGSANDIHSLVLRVFQEPQNLAREHGLHVDDVVRRLGFPKNIVMDAISYLADLGHIYSTIDEYHFKSPCN